MKDLRIIFVLALSLLLGLSGVEAEASGVEAEASGVEAEAAGLTPEMVVDLNTVSEVAVDPRGELVAYTLSVQRAPEDEKGSRYSELWLVGTGQGEPRQFTASKGNVSAPAWSPDGKMIAFLAKRKPQHEETQIYQISRDGGEARLLTRHDAAINLYRWSPDGKSLAFVDGEPQTKEEKENEEKGRDWKVFGEAEKQRRLWLLDLATGESHRLASGLSIWDLEWTPDSRGLILQATVSPRTDESIMFRKLLSLALPHGEPEVLVATEGKLGPMALSPDGRHLAFLGAVSLDDPLAQSLFLVSLSGRQRGGSRLLTDGYKGSAADVAWVDDQTLLLHSVEGAHSALFRVDAQSGKRTSVAWPDLVINQVDVVDGQRPMAMAAHSRSHPPEIYVIPPGSAKPLRRTRHNPELETVRLAKQEVVNWKGADQWEMSGVLTYPLDYKEGQRYPLVLQIHGGPEGVSMDGWTSRPTYPVQVLAGAGFFVFQPNYRGSQGRGVAFSTANHNDLGGKEFDDVLAGIDALVHRGWVDPERVGTGGWSYGGYFSALAATRHSGRFKAAAVCAGVSNWVSFTGTTDIPNEMSIVHWSSWWFDDPALHWQRSPLAHVNKAQTPTLIVHGAKDDRVHPGQSLELHSALRLKEVPTSLVLYPREPHGLNERAHQLDYMDRLVDWFNKRLDTAKEETSSSGAVAEGLGVGSF